MTPQLRIGKWFGRRETTKWSEKESRALKNTKGTPEEDWECLESLYLNPNFKYKRRDIFTLLNNWPGEIDKARRFVEDNGGYASSVIHECIPPWKYEVMNILRLTIDEMPKHLKMRYDALPEEAKEFLYGVASEAQRELLKK